MYELFLTSVPSLVNGKMAFELGSSNYRTHTGPFVLVSDDKEQTVIQQKLSHSKTNKDTQRNNESE